MLILLRYKHSWCYEGINIIRDDHQKKEPMDPNISTSRFVNASLHVYITITIKEQNEVVVVGDLFPLVVLFRFL